MQLVIGNKNYSSWSLRPWLGLKVAGIEFEEILLPLYEENARSKRLVYSPSGKVPLLADGTLRIWDSLAIAEYLAEQFPARKMWPADREARAIARAVSAEMHSGFQALRSQLPMNMHRDRPAIAYNADAQRDIDRIQEIWRDCRARFGGAGHYLFGAPTIADAMFAPVVSRFAS